MSAVSVSSELPPTIDPVAAARWAARDPQAASAWLHEEVARRMEERLGWMTLRPQTWAHWQPVRGGLQAHGLLSQRYPEAACYVVEAQLSHQAQAQAQLGKPWWSPARWKGAAPRFEAPPATGVQMLWANMALHHAPDPQALLTQWHRALAVDGFVMFSCLGPDTLRELRRVYAEQGWPAPSHEFTDMHDWGDMLVHAGFAEPVMDMERITLSFASPERLLQELRELGRNLHPARFAGLRGRGWQAQLHAALAQKLVNPKEEGRLTLTFEVIYGHAFKPVPKSMRLKVQAESQIGLDEMRAALKQGRKSPSA